MIRALNKLLFSAAAALVMAGIAAAQGSEEGERNYQLQIGLNYLMPNNLEDPFIDLTMAGGGYWSILRRDAPDMDYGEAMEAGLIDLETGLLRSLPDDARMGIGPGVLGGMRIYPKHYAGAYILEWEGDAHAFIVGQPRDLQTRIGQNKLMFFVRPENGRPLSVRFSQLRGDGLKSIRLYRDEHKELIERGEIWNPDFIEMVRKNDIVRTMMFQTTNESPVRSFTEVARPEDAFYANTMRPIWPSPPRYGVPYEVLFDLALKSDTALWTHVPAMIGMPTHLSHPSMRNDEDKISVGKINAEAKTHWRTILGSPEWDIFAREFADRLVASGYPQERPLYVELGNEIWNYAYPFALATAYFQGFAQGMKDKMSPRIGYGVLSARWASALEQELEERGVSYNIIYVLGSHTAMPSRSAAAMRSFRRQLEQMGANADEIVAKTGIALTTYSKCSAAFGKQEFGDLEDGELRAAWERAIREEREDLKHRLHDFCVNGREVNANKNWIVKRWRQHHREAQRQGFRLLGAYEGGSHDVPPEALRESPLFEKWWIEYHWGPLGADVVRQINQAIIEEFPGVILSNFGTMGRVGAAPWLEGHYSRETDLMRVWDEFERPLEAE